MRLPSTLYSYYEKNGLYHTQIGIKLNVFDWKTMQFRFDVFNHSWNKSSFSKNKAYSFEADKYVDVYMLPDLQDFKISLNNNINSYSILAISQGFRSRLELLLPLSV